MSIAKKQSFTLKRFTAKKSSNKGFSLVELLVVLAIIVVLLSIGVPTYRKYKEGAKVTADEATLNSLNNAALVLDATEKDIDKASIAEAVKGVDETEIQKLEIDTSGNKWCIQYNNKCVNEDGEIDEKKNTCAAAGECQ